MRHIYELMSLFSIAAEGGNLCKRLRRSCLAIEMAVLRKVAAASLLKL